MITIIQLHYLLNNVQLDRKNKVYIHRILYKIRDSRIYILREYNVQDIEIISPLKTKIVLFRSYVNLLL